VKCELHVEAPGAHHGGPAQTDSKDNEGEYKAKTKTMKGCDPDFRGEALKFKAIPGVVEELTFVRFTIRDDEIVRDDLAAWACVRLDRLRQGYRFVHLLNCKGKLTDGVLLVKISKKLV
jgi:phosphatidylinositol phospholipase C, delta